MKPKDLPVPAEKFKAKFGVDWKAALADNKVFNALDACKHFGVDASGRGEEKGRGKGFHTGATLLIRRFTRLTSRLSAPRTYPPAHKIKNIICSSYAIKRGVHKREARGLELPYVCVCARV